MTGRKTAQCQQREDLMKTVAALFIGGLGGMYFAEFLVEEKAANKPLTGLAERQCNLTSDSGSIDREVIGHAT
jgi:hypothetical protein